MLSYILTGLAALCFGVFAGGRITLARQRWRELRAMFTRHQNAESLEQAFVATLEQRRRFETANLVHHVRVVNAIQFVILCNWDLSTLLGLLDQTREAWSQGWSRKLHARVLALTILGVCVVFCSLGKGSFESAPFHGETRAAKPRR